jgi:hypothetical protein
MVVAGVHAKATIAIVVADTTAANGGLVARERTEPSRTLRTIVGAVPSPCDFIVR